MYWERFCFDVLNFISQKNLCILHRVIVYRVSTLAEKAGNVGKAGK